jgi:hypothetical protein
MKKINEYELLNRVNGLREKIVESEQHADEGVMDTLGKYAAPAWNAVKGAAGKAANWVGNNPGKTALGVAGTSALAANALGGKPAAAPAAAPAGTTKPAGGGKSDPAVMKLQQDLIAKGAKIKADGIMGPATAAAQQQFGGAAAPAPAPAPAPAAPETSMDDSDDAAAKPFVPPGSAALAPAADGSNAATAIPTGGLENPANQAKPAAAPAPTPASIIANSPVVQASQSKPAAGAPAAGAPAAGSPEALKQMSQQALQTGQMSSTDDLMKQAQAMMAAKQAKPAAQVAVPPSTPGGYGHVQAAESVGFRNDELSRIISLVHHR